MRELVATPLPLTVEVVVLEAGAVEVALVPPPPPPPRADEGARLGNMAVAAAAATVLAGVGVLVGTDAGMLVELMLAEQPLLIHGLPSLYQPAVTRAAALDPLRATRRSRA